MTYKYNKSDNTVSPFLEKPDIKNFDLGIKSHSYITLLKEYEKSIATRIPVSGEHKWRDGYLVTEGVHFAIQHQIFYGGRWKMCAIRDFENWEGERRIVATPLLVNEGKEQKDMEILLSGIEDILEVSLVLSQEQKLMELFNSIPKVIEGKEAESEDDCWDEVLGICIKSFSLRMNNFVYEANAELKKLKQFTITRK